MNLARWLTSRLTRPRSPGRQWWYVYALWMALPAVILGAFALRTVRGLRLEAQQAAAEQRRQAARAADAAIDRFLDELPTHSAAIPFSIEPGNVVALPRDRVYFADFGVRPAAARLPFSPGTLELADRLQFEDSPPARDLLFRKIAQSEPALAAWSHWSRAGHPGSLPAVEDGARTPSGLPLALLAAESATALAKLRAGQWWLSYEERALHDDELRRRTGDPPDPRLKDLALANQLLPLALPRLAAGERRVFLSAPAAPILFTGDSSRGTAITAGALTTLLQPQLAAAGISALRSTAAHATLWSNPATATHPLVEALPAAAVPGWEYAFVDSASAAAGHQQWLWYGFIGLLLLMLGSGLVMTAKVARQEMELARRQSDFVAAVTHELKSPITSIRLLLERLSRQRVVRPESITEYYSAMESETARLERLVNRVLDSQRIEAGRMTWHFELCSLPALLAASVERFQTQAAARRITVTATLPDHLDLIADERSLTEAVDNLIDNAIRYSGADSTVEVGVELTPAEVTIVVRDHGIGIDPADLPHLFTRFYRGRRGDRYNVRGTGLGLTLVKAAADAHGGRAEAANHPGGGSVFRLTIPLRRDSIKENHV